MSECLEMRLFRVCRANLTSSPRMSENLVISEGGTCLTMKLPGYDYSCLTRAGMI